MAEQDKFNQYLQILSETKGFNGDELDVWYKWNQGAKQIVDEFKSKMVAERMGVVNDSTDAHSYKKRFDEATKKLGFEEAVLAIDAETASIEPEKLPDWYQAHPKASEIMQMIHNEIDHR